MYGNITAEFFIDSLLLPFTLLFPTKFESYLNCMNPLLMFSCPGVFSCRMCLNVSSEEIEDIGFNKSNKMARAEKHSRGKQTSSLDVRLMLSKNTFKSTRFLTLLLLCLGRSEEGIQFLCSLRFQDRTLQYRKQYPPYHPELPLLTYECVCKEVSVHETGGKGNHRHGKAFLVSLRDVS